MQIQYIRAPFQQAIDIYAYIDNNSQNISITGSYSVIPFASEPFTEYASGQRFYFSGSGYFGPGSGISYSIPIYLQDSWLNYPSGTSYINSCLTGSLFYSGNPPNSPFSARFTGIVYDPTISLQESLLRYESGYYLGRSLTGNIFHSGNNNYNLTTTGILSNVIFTIFDDFGNQPQTGYINNNVTGVTYSNWANLDQITGLVNFPTTYESWNNDGGIFFSDNFDTNAYGWCAGWFKNNNVSASNGTVECWFKADTLENNPIILIASNYTNFFSVPIASPVARISSQKIGSQYQLYSDYIFNNTTGETYRATGFITTGQWYHLAWTQGRYSGENLTTSNSQFQHVSRFYVNGEIAGPADLFWSGYSPDGVTQLNYSGYFTGGIPTGLALLDAITQQLPADTYATGFWSTGLPMTGNFASLSIGSDPGGEGADGFGNSYSQVDKHCTGVYALVRTYATYNIGPTDISRKPFTGAGQYITPYTSYPLQYTWNKKYLDNTVNYGGFSPTGSLGLAVINSLDPSLFYNINYSGVLGNMVLYCQAITGTPLPNQY